MIADGQGSFGFPRATRSLSWFVIKVSSPGKFRMSSARPPALWWSYDGLSQLARPAHCQR